MTRGWARQDTPGGKAVKPDSAAASHDGMNKDYAGDGILIPSQWWHAVESLDEFNGLVNFWWRQSPEFMDTPQNTLLMALLSLRDLPRAQRDAWRALFDHYVFDAGEHTAAHLPPAARGVLAPLDEPAVRGLRARLLRRLNR